MHNKSYKLQAYDQHICRVVFQNGTNVKQNLMNLFYFMKNKLYVFVAIINAIIIRLV